MIGNVIILNWRIYKSSKANIRQDLVPVYIFSFQFLIANPKIKVAESMNRLKKEIVDLKIHYGP